MVKRFNEVFVMFIFGFDLKSIEFVSHEENVADIASSFKELSDNL